MNKVLLLALPTVVLSACAFTPARPLTEPHTYVLSVEPQSLDSAGTPRSSATATLLVTLPQAQAGFDSPRMAYLLRPHEVRYYADSLWADTPARMLARLLVQALERTGTWRAVVLMPTPVRWEYRLDSDDLALQQEFVSKPSRIRVTLHLRLVDQRGQAVVAARRFEIVEEAESEDPYGGVLAANRAVAGLLDQVSKWVIASLDEQPQRGR